MTAPNGDRVPALDVLRGAIVAAMILVNNPGDWTTVFPPLLHAYWTGFTFADLVFPAFIFIMGVAVGLKIPRRRAAGLAMAAVYRRVWRRVVVLVAIGLALNAMTAWPSAAPLRIPGVLQRIALAYLAVNAVVLHVRPSRWLFVVATLLLGHWALLAWVPFDGYPAGTLTPDHNVARYLDAVVFGRHALAIPNDPEGVLGTLPAAATALLGAAAGDAIRRAPSDPVRTRTLAAGGGLAVALGLLWSGVLPLSKPLWTGSFTLLTAGLTALMLALATIGVDSAALRRWLQPLVWLGVNPLAIYIGSEVIGHLLDAAWLPLGTGRTSPKGWVVWEVLYRLFPTWPGELISLAFGLLVVTAWVGAAGLLYRNAIRLRV